MTILPQVIIDFLPPMEVLQTVVTDFVSPHQSRPKLSASVMAEVGCTLLHLYHYSHVLGLCKTVAVVFFVFDQKWSSGDTCGMDNSFFGKLCSAVSVVV